MGFAGAGAMGFVTGRTSFGCCVIAMGFAGMLAVATMAGSTGFGSANFGCSITFTGSTVCGFWTGWAASVPIDVTTTRSSWSSRVVIADAATAARSTAIVFPTPEPEGFGATACCSGFAAAGFGSGLGGAGGFGSGLIAMFLGGGGTSFGRTLAETGGGGGLAETGGGGLAETGGGGGLANAGFDVVATGFGSEEISDGRRSPT